ncbi:hypothetical protein KJ966_08545 [bacterium]|nr:hypothetical protein [bacterium]
MSRSVKASYNLKVRFHKLSHVPERAELSLIHNPNNLLKTAQHVIDLVSGMEGSS